MGSVFNVAETIEIGIEKERRRRDFYGMVADNAKEKEMKELFTNLRDWEETHIEKFSEIKSKVTQTEASESYPGEFKDYMSSLIDEKLYKDITPELFSKIAETPLSAVQHGILFEKDAILFFSELLPYLTKSHKELVQTLIDEEKKHIIYLSKLREKIKSV